MILNINKGDRVRFTDKPFLSNGTVIDWKYSRPPSKVYIIKLDEEAPSEYAYGTDRVLSFGHDIEVINDTTTNS